MLMAGGTITWQQINYVTPLFRVHFRAVKYL
jgi:hypothetical protein